VTTLTDRAWERVRTFVADGGVALATYKTGMLDACGRARGPFVLWPDSGLRSHGEVKTTPPYWVDKDGLPQDVVPPDPNQFLMFDGPRARKWHMDFSALTAGGGWAPYEIPGYLDNSLHVPAPALHVKASRAWKNLVPFAFRVNPKDPPKRGVGLAYRKLGKGLLFYLNADVGHLFSRADIPQWRGFFQRLLHRAAGDRCLMAVEAPASVYVSLWRQPQQGRYVIHLVNDLSTCGRPASRARMREDVVPVDATLLLRLPGGLKRVRQVVGNASMRDRPMSRGFKVILHNITERVILTAE
jgi:hypothetical protein